LAHAVKVSVPPTDPDDLAALAGSYWSEELGVRWKIELDDGGQGTRLVLVHRKYGRTPMEAIAPEVFVTLSDREETALWLTLEFDRSPDGDLTFAATTGRVRRLRFHRE